MAFFSGDPSRDARNEDADPSREGALCPDGGVSAKHADKVSTHRHQAALVELRIVHADRAVQVPASIDNARVKISN